MIGLEAFDGVGDEEADGVDGLRLELGIAAHTDKNGRGGILVLVEQQAVFRLHDHHARRLDFIDLADGAREFALHGAGVVGALDEIGNAEVRLVENLEAHALALRNILGRELHPHRINLVLRHQNRAAAGLVGNFRVVKHGDDLGRFTVGKPAVEQAVIGARRPQRKGDQPADQHKSRGRDADALAGAELAPNIAELRTELGKVLVHSVNFQICIRMISW